MSSFVDILVKMMSRKLPALSTLPTHFDYQTVLHHLAEYKKPRDKLSSLIEQGEIIRVRKGLYVLGRHFNRPYSEYVLANLIFGPSYVSRLSALSFWGAIPERVEEVQSVTPKRNKTFSTPVGTYTYQYCRPNAYHIGFKLLSANTEFATFMATPEKALCDFLVKSKEIRSTRDIEVALESMRFNSEILQSLRLELVSEIAKRYQRRNLEFLARYLKETL